MKKFLFEILVFSIILISILKLIKFSVPYYWGNELLSKKMKYLENSSLTFNTYFIGSSQTYRHINPIIFEEITGNSTFNLGSPGTHALEVEYLIDNLISKQNIGLSKNIYLQKIHYRAIQDRHLHSIRANYFFDAKRLFRGVEYFANLKNYRQVYYHIISYIENQLCIGQIIKILKFNLENKKELDDSIIEQNGFYSLDQELKDFNRKPMKRRNVFFNREIKNRGQKTMYTKELNIGKLNWEKLGINEYSNLTNLWHITGNPNSGVGFYFDRVHYNEKGANKFTNQIGNIVAGVSETKNTTIVQNKIKNIPADKVVKLNYIDALAKNLNLTALQKRAIREINEECEKQKKLISKYNKNLTLYKQNLNGINNMQTKKLAKLLGIDLYKRKRNFDIKWEQSFKLTENLIENDKKEEL